MPGISSNTCLPASLTDLTRSPGRRAQLSPLQVSSPGSPWPRRAGQGTPFGVPRQAFTHLPRSGWGREEKGPEVHEAIATIKTVNASTSPHCPTLSPPNLRTGSLPGSRGPAPGWRHPADSSAWPASWPVTHTRQRPHSCIRPTPGQAGLLSGGGLEPKSQGPHRGHTEVSPTPPAVAKGTAGQDCLGLTVTEPWGLAVGAAAQRHRAGTPK